MSRRVTSTATLATLIIASFCLVGTSSTAEAGWGHFRHHHFHGHRYHVGFRHWGWGYGVGWPSYSYYGFAPYRVSYPVYYRSYYPVYRSYAPSYYYTPDVDCGCCGTYGYSPSVSYSGYDAGNPVPSASVASLKRSITSPAVKQTTQLLGKEAIVSSGNIVLKLNVPEDARVTINNRPTTAIGSERTYNVRGGLAADSYPFVVRAEVERDGRLVSQTQRVNLRGGQSSALTFRLEAESKGLVAADDVVNTTVRLRVPKDARVFLAGREMKQTGEVRVFETTRLGAGEEIQNYSVRVITDDGKIESRELTLVGGKTQDLEFGFESVAERLVVR